jgi:hypothetical protein
MAATGMGIPVMAGRLHGRGPGRRWPALVILLVFASLALTAQAQVTPSGGTPLWTYTIEKSVGGAAISPDGSLVMAIADDAKAYAFTGQGELSWTYPLGFVMTTVAVAPDGSRVA